MSLLDHPRTFLGSEPGRIRNALVSLDHILEADTDESLHGRVDQQADWIIGELSHAIHRIRRAQTAVEAARAIARCEAAEAEQARAAA